MSENLEVDVVHSHEMKERQIISFGAYWLNRVLSFVCAGLLELV